MEITVSEQVQTATIVDESTVVVNVTPVVNQIEINPSASIPNINANGIVVTPHGTITATTLQLALEQLADQKFVQNTIPISNVEKGDFWLNPDDETLYVYREISTGVYNWVPVMIGNISPDSDTIDAGSY